MVSARTILIAILALTVLTSVAPAQAPAPSFAKQVRPFLAKYCLECHNADKNKGELNLETFKTLSAGGKNGPAFVAGKPEESRLVTMVEKKQKPVMPPEKAKQPTAEEFGVLRAWVAAGATDDTGNIKVTLPPIKPRSGVPAPVAALAYHPDNKRLVAGLYGEVVFIDIASGDVVGKLPGQTEAVSALALSKDGKTLAVASGAPGVRGEVRIYPVPATGVPNEKPTHIFAGHKDVLYTLAFAPDSKTLASAGYDRIIRVWDTAQGKEIRPLKDHSDAVYGLAFNHDGTLLASASADRAVKVWEVRTGRRLYTLSDSTDWLYALAWSPDGKHLAAGGVDQSIRVWQVNAETVKLVQSAYAHEAPVLNLMFGADGKTLYSAGEDRVVKSWDTANMRERRVYPKQPEAVQSLAVRGDQKQVAIGRHDGVLVLLEEPTGKPQAQPLPAKPKPPQMNKVTPSAARRGAVVRIRLEGQSLDGVTEIATNVANATIKLLEGKTATALEAEVTIPAATPAGSYMLTAKSPAGMSAALPFHVDAFPVLEEVEPNDSPGTGQKLSLPASIAGTIGKAGDIDYLRFEAKAGQQVGVQVVPADRAKLEPVLQLLDASGRAVAEGSDVLGYTCPQAGTYILGLRDRDFRGGGLDYRLHAGDLPVVTSLFPLGLQRGSEADVRVSGVNLGDTKTVRVKAGEAMPGATVPVPLAGAPLGPTKLVVGEFAEVVRTPGADAGPLTLAVPGTGNGVIDRAGKTDTWTFTAKKGQRLIVEINARRLGTPLDSFMEILDDKGQPVPRATLRCVARTYTTFRDHDSADANIRMETWNDFAMNDYVLVGEELLKIRELPKNPDDNCQFFAVEGKRVGHLDTTPTHHSMGVPMYKVAIHPPGSTFPPNGLPVVTLNYRNDDGGAGYGKDSRIFFDPPADGTYRVRVADARGQAGPTFAYRLTVRPPRPDFRISFNPTSPSVWKGGAVPVTVTATRVDGFDGRIDVNLENLPAGFSAPGTHLAPGDTTTSFSLWADADAKAPTTGMAPKLVAKATIDGKAVVREVAGQLPKIQEPGDLVTTTDLPEVTVKPGGEVRLQVKIDRRNNFKGRVPLDVKGLPHGVRVLDIGLNGILIIPGETSRTVVIYCEPWVQETEHPFVVLSRREGKNTEHAAKSVLLKVKK